MKKVLRISLFIFLLTVISNLGLQGQESPIPRINYREIMEQERENINKQIEAEYFEKYEGYRNKLNFDLNKALTQDIAAVAIEDSLALVDLYNSTNGNNWKNNTNWLQGPVSSWYGVALKEGRVNGIYLGDNNLVGSLPATIGNFTNLEYLYLYQNMISGQIPPEIGNLTNLRHLIIDHNQLSGIIQNAMENLKNLESLDLGDNMLTGQIPPEIGNLTNLISLSLYSNQLSGTIPTALENLTNLEYLYLYGNMFTGPIPAEIGNLTNLRSLYLYSNQLSGNIPPEIGNLSNLEWLLLRYNELSGEIPNELWRLTNLEGLIVNNNKLSGTISDEIKNLDSLISLNLSNNNFEGSFPNEIYNLTNLEYLNIYYNNFTGNIQPSISNLTNLRILDFGNNQINGTIPKEIGTLHNLIFLQLGGNQISGPIPSEIGNLTQITHLYLYHNQLSGDIPAELGNLTNLEWIILDSNNLSGRISSWIENLKKLETLWIYNNQIQDSIPATIGNLDSLTWFGIWDNQFYGIIPEEIGNLKKLKGFDIGNNNLSGVIPVSINNLKNLWTISIGNNNFEDLCNLSSIDSLKNLYIDNNKFTFEDIEPNIGICNYFVYSPQDSVGIQIDTTITVGSSLSLSVEVGGQYNQYQWKKNGMPITGTQSAIYTILSASLNDIGSYTCEITNTLATELTLYSRPINVNVQYTRLQIDSLALVDLYNSTNGNNWKNNTNWLQGPVSSWYGVAVNEGRVVSISLNQNHLSGSLPSTIGNLTNLTYLELSYNQLSGTIPTALGNLINLEWILLSSNKLSGQIPPEIGNLTKLRALYLYSNQLSGAIPSALGNLINLEWILLSSNKLSGQIPPEIGNLTKLRALHLGSNQLSGTIPTTLGNLMNLESLTLDNNIFTGQIPPEIGNLTNLKSLYLFSNQLSGTIPATLGNLMNLESLWLENNMLTGQIPPEIGNLTNLRSLALYYNQLSGTIPATLGNLKNLESLRLDINMLTGQIPQEIGNLTNLITLSLYSNQLSGTIPISLGNLSNLLDLYLDRNMFSGQIPPEIGNLRNLTLLNLSNNEFSGTIPNSITELKRLKSLYISSNELSVLDNLSSLDSLERLNIDNNKFTFEDIEPNIGVPSEQFIYAPQDSVGNYIDTVATVGRQFLFQIHVGGNNNKYQWRKNGELIDNTTDNIYFAAFSPQDTGSYTCEITNTVATELTLYSRPIHVNLNYSPQIVSSPPLYAFLRKEYRYQLVVDDADDSDFVFSFLKNPGWLSIRSDGLIYGMPPEEFRIDSISVQVSDGYASAIQNFTITILPYSLEVTYFSASLIELQWSLPSIMDTVRIKYGTDADNLNQTAGIWTSISNGKTTVRDLNENTKYYFQLFVSSSGLTNFNSIQHGIRTKINSWSTAFPNSSRSVSTGDRYTLVNIPYLATEDNRLKTIFKQETYNNRELRVFSINLEGKDYDELNDSWNNEIMVPGHSYLASSKQPLTLDAGYGESIADSNIFVIDVPSVSNVWRWAMIANPFDEEKSIESLIDADEYLYQKAFYRYDSQAALEPWKTVMTGRILPFQPVLVCLKRGGKVPLYRNGQSNPGFMMKNSKNRNWNIEIAFINKQSNEKIQLFAGVNQSSQIGHDINDILKPPSFDPKIDYYFINDSLPSDKFIADFRETEQSLYNFEIYFSLLNNSRYLFALEKNDLPSNFEVLIIDRQNNVYFEENQIGNIPNEGNLTILCGDLHEVGRLKEDHNKVPQSFKIYQNYPNPFNSTTTIQFDLPFYSKVDVIIYNILGKKVKHLLKNEYKIGSQKIIWSGKNDNGIEVTSGLYLYVIKTDSDSFSKKMLLLR